MCVWKVMAEHIWDPYWSLATSSSVLLPALLIYLHELSIFALPCCLVMRIFALNVADHELAPMKTWKLESWTSSPWKDISWSCGNEIKCAVKLQEIRDTSNVKHLRKFTGHRNISPLIWRCQLYASAIEKLTNGLSKILPKFLLLNMSSHWLSGIT